MIFVNLTSVNNEILNLRLKKSTVSAVYMKVTAGGKFTVVVSSGVTYFVKESVEEVLKKVNSWF